MATGTSTDPYIVGSWEEFLEYNTDTYTGSYVKFNNNSGRTISYDLAHLYPSGFNRGLIVYPHILGNGVTWKGFFSKNGQYGIDFKGTVDDLNISGMLVYDAWSLITFEGSTYTNLKLSAEMISSSDLYVFNRNVPNNLVFDNCQMELKCTCRSGALRSIYLAYGVQATTHTFNNCDIYIDWRGWNGVGFNIATTLNATLFRGYAQGQWRVTFWDFKQGTSVDYPDTLIDVFFDVPAATYSSWTGDTHAKLFYNSEKMPEFLTPSGTYGVSTDWVGLTSAQIGSETALNTAGFHTGGDSPWIFVEAKHYVDQEDWVTMKRLGAFTDNVQFRNCNSARKTSGGSSVRQAIMPPNTQKLGRYSFNINQLTDAILPSACTYYATTFNNIPVSGGTLINE